MFWKKKTLSLKLLREPIIHFAVFWHLCSFACGAFKNATCSVQKDHCIIISQMFSKFSSATYSM